MTKSTHNITISNWLNNKLVNGENGIILDNDCFCSFDPIQDFVESIDHRWKTPAIYYQAFPEESSAQFLDTLSEELTSKLGNFKLKSNQSLLEIIKSTALKMVIIDRSYLQPLDTLQHLVNIFSLCDVSLILVGSGQKMEIAQILTHPITSTWERFRVGNEHGILPKI